MIELNDNPVQVSQYFESLAIHETTTILSVICDYCKQYDLDESEIVPYLTDNIKKKIHIEAEKSRLYKTKTATL
jgi:hypothetical protein